MLKNIKNLSSIIISSILCIFLGIMTFLTFLNQGFIPLTEKNLQFLLILDAILVIFFFYLIFKNVYQLFSLGEKSKTGSGTNVKYVTLFSLFTFIPSLLIAIFSLYLFNFGIQNFFNTQITKAVNNSFEVAKNYLEESKKTVESDVILMSVGINRVSGLFYSDLNRFKNIVRSERLLRRIDDVFLIDSSGNQLFSETNDPKSFTIPVESEFNLALEGLPVFISNNVEDKTTVMFKLNNLIDTYLYISRNIDPKILKYLNDTEEAVNFYYTVESKQFGIKVTFAIIYIIVVSLLLFLSTVIAISFATRLTKPIVNLISASENISMGVLDSKVPEIETDDEFKMLNKNFNNMIERLKKQQDKLIITERYSAWESVARKLAHEIKNPLTPIQLSIDRLKDKYTSRIAEGQKEFNNYLETINRQIKDIETLVNEFSSFARMPSPIFKKIDICEIIDRAVNFLALSSKNSIIFKKNKLKFFINGDEEQLYRMFINLIKNSEEAILERKQKTIDLKGLIELDINKNNDYIVISLSDNGIGIVNKEKIMTPYFTTKKNGTGLGLPIVNKIINEHSGEFSVSNKITNKGVEVLITFPLINE